ncbi:MAG: hypothetical protein WC456_02535 [Patescibacteria group bacterium]
MTGIIENKGHKLDSEKAAELIQQSAEVENVEMPESLEQTAQKKIDDINQTALSQEKIEDQASGGISSPDFSPAAEKIDAQRVAAITVGTENIESVAQGNSPLSAETAKKEPEPKKVTESQLKSDLEAIKDYHNQIKELTSKKRGNYQKDKIIVDQIHTIKGKLEAEFGLDKYSPSFNVMSKAYQENINVIPDEPESGPVATADSLSKMGRQDLENIKIKEGKIQGVEYKELKYARENLQEELSSLVESLVSTKINNDFEGRIEALANKTGLSPEALREICQDQEAAIVAEAKGELSKNSGFWKKAANIGITSSVYIGAGILAGTSIAATLGLGGLAGMSIIGGARIVDRSIREYIGKNKLDKKVAEIKGYKTEADKTALQDRLAAAISLKKTLEIDRVDLKDQEARAKLIDNYIDEQAAAGLSPVQPEELAGYKEKMARILNGLDDIDRLNDQQEQKLNKSGILGKLQKVEKFISGDSAAGRTSTAAVFVGLGFVARQVPIVRQVLAGYAGYRFGAVIGDSILDRKKKGLAENTDGAVTAENYATLRQRLLDQDFQKSKPEEFIKLRQAVAAFEDQQATSADGHKLSELNEQLQDGLLKSQEKSAYKKLKKFAFRAGGAVLGAIGGEALHDVLSHKPTAGGGNMVETANAKGSLKGVSVDDILSRGQKGVIETVRMDEAVADASSSKGSVDVDEMLARSQQSDYVSPENNIPSSDKSHLFEDVVSNKDLKPGQHDSLWRSTEQIFKNHASELGYKGDMSDKTALEHWAQGQTAKTLNNSGDLLDKVYEGNKIIIEQDETGNYRIHVEQGEGLEPGHLEHPVKSGGANLDENMVKGSSKYDAEEIARNLKDRAFDPSGRNPYDINTGLHHDPMAVEAGSADSGTHDLGDELHEMNKTLHGQTDIKSPLYPDPFSFSAEQAVHPVEHPSPHVDHSVSGGKGTESDIKVDKPVEVIPPKNQSLVENLEGSGGGNKTIDSIAALKDMPNGAKIPVGELTLVKQDNRYNFTNAQGETIKMTINKFGGFGQNDRFGIIRDGRILDGKLLSEAIPLKQTIYNNLPDKQSALAKELLEEIAKNKEEVEFLSGF